MGLVFERRVFYIKHMISFNLKCAGGHDFEGWFSSSADYEDQLQQGLLNCPICGDLQITKALMAPNVGAKSNSRGDTASAVNLSAVKPPSDAPAPPMPSPAQMEAMAKLYAQLRVVQNKVEEECDYVGDRFADEARKIHYGEAEDRGIYGQSSPEDVAELQEEGIEIASMPWLPPEN